MIQSYKMAFDAAPVPMILVAEDGTVAMANQHALSLFDYDADGLLGQSVDILVPHSARGKHPELRAAYNKFPTKRGMGVGRDLHGLTRTGVEIPLEVSLEQVSSNNKTWTLLVAIDLRHRKRERELIDLALEASASSMVMVNQHAQIVYVNPACLNLVGYEPDQLIGRPVNALVPDSAQTAHGVYTSSFMTAPRKRAMGDTREIHIRHADGRQIPVEIALTPVETPDARFVMCTIVDLSERLSNERALRNKNTELAQLNEELSQFAYSASHDLKAPLTSISGLLEICIEDLASADIEEVRRNLSRALDISRGSSEKIERLLSLARSPDVSDAFEDTCLKTMVSKIWRDNAPVDRVPELRQDFASEGVVRTQPVVLSIVMENLLSNALRYLDPDKPESIIQVTSQDHPETTDIIVSDNGIGIPAEFQPRVFDMFQRFDKRSGDGIGLSLVRKNLQRLGGQIKLESTLGEGTSVTVSLPKQKAEP